MSLFSRTKTEIDLIPGTIKQFPDAYKDTIRKFSSFTPGKELAKGIGVTFSLEKAEEEQRKLDEQTRRLHESLMSDLMNAKKNNDLERKKRLLSLAKQFGNYDTDNILEAILKNAPTNAQVIGGASELALFAAVGLKPGLGTSGKLVSGQQAKIAKQLRQVQEFQRLKDAGKIKRLFFKKGIPIVRESLIGSGIFAAVKAQEENASTEDIVRAGEIGLLVGGGITGLAIGTTEFLGGAQRFFGPKVSKAIREGVENLEKIASEEKQIIGETEIDRTLSTIGAKRTIQRFGAEAFLKGVQAVRQFKARFVDRFSSLQRVEDAVGEVKGAPLSEEERVYRDARLLTSAADADAESRIIKLGDKLRPYNNVIDKARAYLLKLDYIDRAKLGQKTPGGQSLKELKKGLRQIIQEIGPNDMPKVGRVRQIMRDYHIKLLDDRVDAGVISQDIMDNLLKTHPNYIPHNVIMKMEEKTVQFMSGSLNVPKTDIMKAVGSIKNIEDPFVASVQRTPIATRIIAKNKLLNNLIKAQEQYNAIPGMRILKTGEKKKLSEQTINFFRNGTKETWVVPRDLAIAIKNLDVPLTPGWFRFLTFPTTVLKKGATTFNLSFALPNKFRDKQTALLTSEAFIKSMVEKTGVSPSSVNLSRKEILKLYKESGGYGASVFRDGDNVIFNKLELAGIAETVTINNTGRVLKGIAKKAKKQNPAQLIQTINDRLEQSTRLDVFKKALEAGLSPRDAAFISRDATIDFAKMGSWMQNINKAVPFLNARVQGFINLPRAAISNPEAFARMQLYSAVYPTLALYSHNRRFESYANISQYMKNRYWIIVTGESEVIDSYSGNKVLVPHFISIVKGEGQTLVSGPIQFYLEKADRIDPRSVNEMIIDTIGSASPLEFQTFARSNMWLTLASQLGPLVTIPTGLGNNINPFFGTPIVPEARLEAEEKLQFRKTTPKITRELADIMGVAPARLEFVLNSTGAGVSQDIQRGMDILFGLLTEKDLRDISISKTDFGLGTQVPIARRFFREATEFYSPVSEFRKRQKEEIEVDLNSKRLRVNDKAEEIWNEMLKRDTREERLAYLNSLGDELTLSIKKRIKTLKTTRQSVEALRKNDSIELRARYIAMRLEEMRRDRVPRQDMIDFLNELERTGILTKKTKKMIRILQRTQ